MKTTRRTAVILAIWTLCAVGYASAYFARSTTYDFNPTGIKAFALTSVTVNGQPLKPAPRIPIQRVFKTKWEKWMFAPAGAVESFVTGKKVDVTNNIAFFGC